VWIMAFRSSSRGRSFPRSTKRMVTWGVGPNATALPSSSSLAQHWTNGITLANDNKATIVRIRGELLCFLTSFGSAADGFEMAAGLGIVTAEAFAAGAASTPGALTDADWDGWMWHSFWQVHGVTATIGDAASSRAGVFRIPIDSKAMRKFEDSEVLFGSLETSEEGVAIAETFANTRVLFKLS